jgi:hypothetical protein
LGTFKPSVRITAPVAEPGTVLPRFYGTCRTEGKVLWLGDLSADKKKIDFAMLLGQGYVTGIRRIWLPSKGKLIFSAKSGERIEGAVKAKKWWKKHILYHGSESQQPDPLIVKKEGIAGAQAYRGVAYVMIVGYKLKKAKREIVPIDFELISHTEIEGGGSG